MSIVLGIINLDYIYETMLPRSISKEQQACIYAGTESRFSSFESKALYVDELRPVPADLSKLNSQKDCV